MAFLIPLVLGRLRVSELIPSNLLLSFMNHVTANIIQAPSNSACVNLHLLELSSLLPPNRTHLPTIKLFLRVPKTSPLHNFISSDVNLDLR